MVGRVKKVFLGLRQTASLSAEGKKRHFTPKSVYEQLQGWVSISSSTSQDHGSLTFINVLMFNLNRLREISLLELMS